MLSFTSQIRVDLFAHPISRSSGLILVRLRSVVGPKIFVEKIYTLMNTISLGIFFWPGIAVTPQNSQESDCQL